VLSCIDAGALFELEHELAFALDGCDTPLDQCVTGAIGMIASQRSLPYSTTMTAPVIFGCTLHV
jgi:hypothetical protein